MPIVCPVCNRNDMIQRVTTVVDAGTVRGISNAPIIEGENLIPASSYHASTLANRLKPPAEPKKPEIDWNAGCTLSLLAGFLIYATIASLTDAETVAIGLLCCGLPGILVTIAAYRVFNKPNEAKEQYLHQLAKWNKGIERWQRLYYCARDDILFDPETNEVYPPDGKAVFRG